jgi:hypothetical protein
MRTMNIPAYCTYVYAISEPEHLIPITHFLCMAHAFGNLFLICTIEGVIQSVIESNGS